MRDATTLFEADFGYDAAWVKLFSRDGVNPERSELYAHDARRRLRGMERGELNAAGTAVTAPLADAAVPSAEGWPDLDARGNWPTYSRTVNGVQTGQTRTASGTNAYLTLDPDGPGGEPALTLTHDDNGNLSGDPTARDSGDCGACPCPGGHEYAYDGENRLTQVRRGSDQAVLLEMGYDALGRRVESVSRVAGCPGQSLTRRTRQVYAGLKVIAEYEVAGESVTLAREFVWGSSHVEPVAMIDYSDAGAEPAGTEEVLHYLAGALGSVVALTDAAGQVVERYVYDPYGRTYILGAGGARIEQSAYGNPFAWTGQRYDSSVGLYHFWARTYSPGLGRWLQRDPAGYVDGVNLYEYVGSMALAWTDPLGLSGMEYDPWQWWRMQHRRRRGGWMDKHGAGGGNGHQDCPPPGYPVPPAENPLQWVPNRTPPEQRSPNADPGHYFDPKTYDKWRYHPEDDVHNPHWDRIPRKGPEERIPINDKPVFKPPAVKPNPPPSPRFGVVLVTVGSAVQSFFGNVVIGLSDLTGALQQHLEAIRPDRGVRYNKALTPSSSLWLQYDVLESSGDADE